MINNCMLIFNSIVVNTTNIFHNVQSSSNPIDEMGKEIGNALFPNIPTLIGHLIATTILIVVIWKFCYQPFKDAQTKKFNYIKKQIDKANDKLDFANKNNIKTKKLLQSAKNDSAEIISNAKSDANNIKENNLRSIKLKTKQMLDDSEREIKNNYKLSQQKIKEEIINVGFLAAQKIINEEVKNKKNEEIVDEFLNSLD